MRNYHPNPVRIVRIYCCVAAGYYLYDRLAQTKDNIPVDT